MQGVKSFIRHGLIASVVWMVACGPSEAAQTQDSRPTREEPASAVPAPAAPFDTLAATRLSSAFRGAADHALPAVVSIRVRQTQHVVRNQPRIFQFFGIPGSPEAPQEFDAPVEGTGSGFIIDDSGYIMTNRHVVDDADEVVVTLPDGREFNATVVGTDAMTDVAVVRIEPRNGESLPVARFGDSDVLQVGDWVLALGNPLGLDFTVTAGIVSAKGRQVGILAREGGPSALEAFIQTDAAINPGNSGGPLVDLQGRVVGMNTAIASRTGYYAGYGFAIPITLARKVANDLIEFGAVRRPRLGVEIQNIDAADAEVYGLKEVAGAEVTSVQPGLAAAKAGLKIGDVIVGLDGEPVRDATQLTTTLAQRQPGDRVRLDVIRERKHRTISVALGKFEAEGGSVNERKSQPAVDDVLGFHTESLTREWARELHVDEQEGVVIAEVAPFGPAAQAGLQPGMMLRRLNGHDVTKVADVARIARDIEPGDVVSAVVRIPETGDRIVNYRTRQ